MPRMRRGGVVKDCVIEAEVDDCGATYVGPVVSVFIRMGGRRMGVDWQKIARGIVREVSKSNPDPEVRELAAAVGESMDATKPQLHTIKTWPEPFQAVMSGRKRFEFRRDDRGFAEGDTVRLVEWDPSASDAETGLCIEARIGYVLRGGFGVPDGFVVFSLHDVRRIT